MLIDGLFGFSYAFIELRRLNVGDYTPTEGFRGVDEFVEYVRIILGLMQ